MRWYLGVIVLTFLAVAAGTAAYTWHKSGNVRSEDEESLPSDIRRLIPLHARLGKPKPGEWLAEHFEGGQTYGAYERSRPIRVTPAQRTFYVQPLGPFTPAETKIVALTAEYLGLYFGLPVKVREALPLDIVPKSARRRGMLGDEQILTTYALQEVLKPRLPKDAAVMIALTTSDLWPGQGWNFVFGQASLRDRVGVWSIHRFGKPDQSDEAFRLCLRRAMGLATHETGHMFSMSHCVFYNCNMAGSNHLEEADSRPLAVCPQCLAKLCFATGVRPAERFQRLIAFYGANGLDAEKRFCEKSYRALKGSP